MQKNDTPEDIPIFASTAQQPSPSLVVSEPFESARQFRLKIKSRYTLILAFLSLLLVIGSSATAILTHTPPKKTIDGASSKSIKTHQIGANNNQTKNNQHSSASNKAAQVNGQVAAQSLTQSISSTSSLQIQGNRFVSYGNPVILRGVFYVSFEWACSHGGGVSSQQINQAAINALLSWHINFVRIGVPEDCWLGINGAPQGTNVSTYQQALSQWLALLHQNGIYTEVGLMFAAPGPNLSNIQAPMPDQDHSPAFWQSFAAYFKNEPDTIFGLYGEPHPNMAVGSWSCWLNGGSACSVAYNGQAYTAAGMQQLINIIRSTGAAQPISVSGIRSAADLSEWLTNEPSDPLHQLDAEWHVYGGSPCFNASDVMIPNNPSCWNGVPAQIAKTVPLLNGEVGEQVAAPYSCSWNGMPVYLPWAEQNYVSYAAWKWDEDNPPSCTNDALITDQSGTPTPIYGQGYKDWLLSH